MSVLLFGCAAAFLALAAHPFATYPASLALLRRWRRAPRAIVAATAPAPSFSLLVCAHNEEAVIREKLANLETLLDRAPGEAEALIYLDGSSDRTEEIVAARADERIRVVVSPTRTGKTAGLNRLVALARGEILVLSDANVMVAWDALAKLVPYFADPQVGLACGHLSYVNPEESITARNGATSRRSPVSSRATPAAPSAPTVRSTPSGARCGRSSRTI
jgi:cellulose synthase/poly-beta-1,6-N-acetylglucosamine synthase-like glycosyltransferase